jgi:hypothetical protein
VRSVESQPTIRRDISPPSSGLKNRRSKKPVRLPLPPAFMLVDCLTSSSTLKLEATFPSEASVDFQRTTQSYIPEDRTLPLFTCFTSCVCAPAEMWNTITGEVKNFFSSVAKAPWPGGIHGAKSVFTSILRENFPLLTLLLPWQIRLSDLFPFRINSQIMNGVDEVIGFFNWPNPSSRIMALWWTQVPTEMSTRNFPWVKWRPAREADNLTTICEPIF